MIINKTRRGKVNEEFQKTRKTAVNAMKTRFLAAIEKNYNELKPK
jgi:hypothetical protein